MTKRQRLWAIREVADHFGVHVDTVRKWSDEGDLHPVNVGTDLRRVFAFEDSDIADFKRRRKHVARRVAQSRRAVVQR